MMTSNYVVLSIKSFLEVEIDKYNIMSNVVGRNMSGFEVIRGPSKPPLNNSPSGFSVCHCKSGRNVTRLHCKNQE